YANHDTSVMLPLTDIELPNDPNARALYLAGLAVFIEHSDGERAVQQGEIVYDEQGTPIGIEIEIRKFSTFTIISAADLSYIEYAGYIAGYPDGLFHMDAKISRAETAAILARLMNPGKAAAAAAYTDLEAGHWAADAVQRLSAANILSGDPDGRFRPNDGVTRAEMAMIAAR